ncbi:MAG: glucose-1-phosphate adenylyltransferase [Chlamydiae bacterium]|nr:glucose-1-phosphate adenylyltransferase [Chlamydiota bacterium]
MRILDNKNYSKVSSVASIVLAGGEGTRLKPLTTQRCKPAVSFGGKFRLIDIPISNSMNSNINKIYVISQYLSNSLKKHIDENYLNGVVNKAELELLSPEEKNQGTNWFKGTADAVRKNWHHLEHTNVEYFLILSGDQLYNIDFSDMIEFAKTKNADLVIASLPVNKEDATRMGLLKIDENNKIIDFVEKPKEDKVLNQFKLQKHPEDKEDFYLGSMGIYVFKKEALRKLLTEKGDDFGHDLIPLKVKSGDTYAFIFKGYWEDIGTISAFYKANLALTEPKDHLDINDEKSPIYSRMDNLPKAQIKGTLITDSLISPGALIEAKEIDHSIIGVCTRIQKGTIIKDSVVLGNHYYPDCLSKDEPLSTYFSIGENCIIQKAIIDEHTHIGNNVRLINQNNLSNYDGDGVYIRDGIIVVTSGAKIPDGFTL